MVARDGILSGAGVCLRAGLLVAAVTLSGCGDEIPVQDAPLESESAEFAAPPAMASQPPVDATCEATLAGEPPTQPNFLGIAQHSRCGALKAASDAFELQARVDDAWEALSDETLIFEAASGPISIIENSAQSALGFDQTAANLANGARIATQQLSAASDEAKVAAVASGEAQEAARIARAAQEYITFTKRLAAARYEELRQQGENGNDERGSGINPLYFLIALIAALALGAVFFFARRDSGKGGRKTRETADADDARPVPGSPKASGVSKSYIDDELAKLDHRISALDTSVKERFDYIAEKIDELSAATKNGDAGGNDTRTQSAQSLSPPSSTSAPVPPPQAPPPPPPPPPAAPSGAVGAGFLQSPEVQALINEVNNATKQDRLRGGSTNARVRTFSSDSINAPQVLFEDATDRFWLLPNPSNPNEAALVPGMTIRNGWGQMMRATHDHPLGHHFRLDRGDSFNVQAAALMRKDKTGWELVTRGVVSGIA